MRRPPALGQRHDEYWQALGENEHCDDDTDAHARRRIPQRASDSQRGNDAREPCRVATTTSAQGGPRCTLTIVVAGPITAPIAFSTTANSVAITPTTIATPS
ncbi:hypothetical protein REA19_26020 [Prescottella equi]|nr:hypothetical protein REA19_26020 [Prescottella equi]